MGDLGFLKEGYRKVRDKLGGGRKSRFRIIELDLFPIG
jgi:hypothetical protein